MDEFESPAFYEANTFVTCKHTKLEAPAARMAQVITDERGLTERVHPTVVSDDRRIVRDAISGYLIWKDKVEWVTLDTGELCWRRPAEARGAIIQEDDGSWVRGETNGSVAGYHSARRDWRGARASSTQFAKHVGVELEVGFKSNTHLQKFLSKFVDPNGRFVSNRPFLIESDSSLGGVTCGSEIISEPLKLYEGYQAPDAHWRWLLGKLVEHGAEGWKHRALAGIHVNMDVSDRTAAQILRFVTFVHNAAAISKFVSGRKVIYGSGEGRVSAPGFDELASLDKFMSMNASPHGGGYELITPDRFKALTGGSVFDENAMQKFASRGKYQPVHIRGGNQVLEARIFGSNIRYEGFMACVEYCVGGMEFTSSLKRDLDVLDLEISARFREWLTDNAERYPSLAARIGGVATTSNSKPTVVARPLEQLVA